jgi:hypothetical protein
MERILQPTEMKLRPAILEGETVGIIEDGHGGVIIYRVDTEVSRELLQYLKYDGNDTLIVNGKDADYTAILSKICAEDSTLDFNVQDPEYQGLYERIQFFGNEQKIKWHAIHFVEYVTANSHENDDVNLEEMYENFLLNYYIIK